MEHRRSTRTIRRVMLAVATLATLGAPLGAEAGSAPQVTSVTPNQVTPGSAVVVRIHGSNLNPLAVQITPGHALGFFRVSESEIIVDLYVPDEAVPGATMVRVIGGQTTQCDDCLSIVAGAQVCEALNGRNVIAGTDAGETLTGTGGGDVICARGGNDQLEGAGGDDILLGGAGADRIDGAAGADLGFGGGGADSAQIGTLIGDIVRGEGGDDTFLPQAGGQDLTVADAPAAYGDGGRDLLQGSSLTGPLIATMNAGKIIEIEVAYGSASNDQLRYFVEARGSAGNDLLVGHVGAASVLRGGSGNDQLRGGQYADDLRGGAGADEMDGNRGEDLLLGGAEPDLLYGDAGADVLRGGGGGDTLRGEAGPDELAGQGGVDDLVGGDGGDRLDAVDAVPTRDARIDGGGDDDRCEIDEEDEGVARGCEVRRVA